MKRYSDFSISCMLIGMCVLLATGGIVGVATSLAGTTAQKVFTTDNGMYGHD